MNVTISKLRLMIVEQGKKVNNMNYDLRINALKKAHKETTSTKVEYLSDPYDYEANLALIKAEILRLVELKNALMVANNSTLLKGHNLTISSAINLISEKRSLLNNLDQALMQRPSKVRRSEQNGMSYYEVSELNFDKEMVAAERDLIVEEINQLESLIDQANSETEVSI